VGRERGSVRDTWLGQDCVQLGWLGACNQATQDQGARDRAPRGHEGARVIAGWLSQSIGPLGPSPRPKGPANQQTRHPTKPAQPAL
jgi:hypothetical protein